MICQLNSIPLSLSLSLPPSLFTLHLSTCLSFLVSPPFPAVRRDGRVNIRSACTRKINSRWPKTWSLRCNILGRLSVVDFRLAVFTTERRDCNGKMQATEERCDVFCCQLWIGLTRKGWPSPIGNLISTYSAFKRSSALLASFASIWWTGIPQFVQNLHSGRRLDPQLVHALRPLSWAVISFVLRAGVIVRTPAAASFGATTSAVDTAVGVAAATADTDSAATGVANVAVVALVPTSATAGTASRNSPASSSASAPLRISNDGAGALP